MTRRRNRRGALALFGRKPGVVKNKMVGSEFSLSLSRCNKRGEKRRLCKTQIYYRKENGALACARKIARRPTLYRNLRQKRTNSQNTGPQKRLGSFGESQQETKLPFAARKKIKANAISKSKKIVRREFVFFSSRGTAPPLRVNSTKNKDRTPYK